MEASIRAPRAPVRVRRHSGLSLAALAEGDVERAFVRAKRMSSLHVYYTEEPERDVRPFVVVDLKTTRQRAGRPTQLGDLSDYAESWAAFDSVLAAYRDARRATRPWPSGLLHGAIRLFSERGLREQAHVQATRPWDQQFEIEDPDLVANFVRKTRIDPTLLDDIFVKMSRCFETERILLDVVTDPSEATEALFATAVTRLRADEAVERFGLLNADWWHRHAQRGHFKLHLDFDLA